MNVAYDLELQLSLDAAATHTTRVHPAVKPSTFVALLFTAATAVITPPNAANAQTIKWHPGHYVRFQGDTPQYAPVDTIGDELNHDVIEGAVIRMAWNQLEGPIQNDYAAGIALIQGYLNYLAAQGPQPGPGKQLIIELRERRYGCVDPEHDPELCTNDALPAYLNNDLYTVEVDTGGHAGFIIPNYSNDFVIERYVALLAEIARHFDAHPNFEGFQSGEQAAYLGDLPEPVDVAAWRENFVDLARRAKSNGDDGAGFLHTMFWAPMIAPMLNDTDATQRDEILNDAKAGLYMIDTPPGQYPRYNQVNPDPDSYSEFAMQPGNAHAFPKKTNGEFAGGWQPIDFDNPDRYYMVARWDIQAHHITWTNVRSGYPEWWGDVITWLDNGGSPRTTNLRVPETIEGIQVISNATEDGEVVESGETTNMGGSLDRNEVTIRTGDTATDSQIRGIVSFDTSVIPDDVTIVSAELRLRRNSVTGDSPFFWEPGPIPADAFRVDMRVPPFSANAALEFADFQAPETLADVAPMMSIPTKNGEWSIGELTSVAVGEINKTGRTQFRVYFVLDDNDDGSPDFIKWYSGNAPEGSRPELVVSYD